MSERAVLAGGCFWGMQDLIRRLPGVISTRCGYSGGDVPNATYRNHGTHAEALEVIYDPQALSFKRLLEVFFQIHDPTTLNRQGPNVGYQYRSEIFYTTEEEKISIQSSQALSALPKDLIFIYTMRKVNKAPGQLRSLPYVQGGLSNLYRKLATSKRFLETV